MRGKAGGESAPKGRSSWLIPSATALQTSSKGNNPSGNYGESRSENTDITRPQDFLGGTNIHVHRLHPGHTRNSTAGLGYPRACPEAPFLRRISEREVAARMIFMAVVVHTAVSIGIHRRRYLFGAVRVACLLLPGTLKVPHQRVLMSMVLAGAHGRIWRLLVGLSKPCKLWGSIKNDNDQVVLYLSLQIITIRFLTSWSAHREAGFCLLMFFFSLCFIPQSTGVPRSWFRRDSCIFVCRCMCFLVPQSVHY